MTPIRVVVIDDSAVERRLLIEALESAAVSVVAAAADGRAGVTAVRVESPDVVVLDVEMPGLDGLGALAEIRRFAPRLPVVVYSRLTEHGSRTALEALCRGASDYVAKPAFGHSLEDAKAHIAETLAPRLRALHDMGGHRVAERTGAKTSAGAGAAAVIAVGASTGGPNALARFLASLGSDGMPPMLIVQHMPPLFTPLLAERLTRETPWAVREAAAAERLAPGSARIAPGGRHLTVRPEGKGARTELEDGPPVNSCRPSVDVLFRAVAEVFGDRAVAVVLTGMGRDGLDGTRAVRDRGGWVVAQDEASSVVWGMPGAVARAGLAQAVLPLDEIGPALRVRLGTRARRSS